MFNKIVKRAVVPVLKQTVAGKFSPQVARSMVTLAEKEMGEEARYVRRMEKEAMKAKLEKILEQDDSSSEKQELAKIIGSPAKNDSMIAKLGLDDWKFAVPVGLLVGIPAVANDVIVLSEELQLTACFMLFCSTIYTQFGGMMHKGFQDYSDEIETKFKAVDESMLVTLKAAQDANQQLLTLDSDVKALNDLKDSLYAVKADSLNHEEQHKFRDEIVRKLDSLAALEDSAVSAMKSRLISKVKSEVLGKFKKDEASKEAALAAAIAVIAGGDKAKLGKDIVGDAFKNAIASYTAEYKKQPEGSDEIIKKLEKDIAAVVQAPVFALSGGNVYVTHKIL